MNTQSNSKWLYGCQLGLAQDTAPCRDKRQTDPTARGYKVFSGCPSCIYREPANFATAEADENFENAPKAEK